MQRAKGLKSCAGKYMELVTKKLNTAHSRLNTIPRFMIPRNSSCIAFVYEFFCSGYSSSPDFSAEKVVASISDYCF